MVSLPIRKLASRYVGLALAAMLGAGCGASRAGVGATIGPTTAPAVDEWRKDSLLGKEGFWARTLAFERDYDGRVSATLIRRPLERERQCAVLYLHGYIDYFFQAHLADYYQHTRAGGQPGKGCDFFALDLRKHGRSLPPRYPYPNFAKSLDEYFPEITKCTISCSPIRTRKLACSRRSPGGCEASRAIRSAREISPVTQAW